MSAHGTPNGPQRSHSRASSIASESGPFNNNSNNIKVIARFRPLIQTEQDSQSIASFPSQDSVVIEVPSLQEQQQQQLLSTPSSGNSSASTSTPTNGSSNTFTFDRVFGPDSNQSDIFEYSLKPIVDDIMRGYNGTVFAYGQTGSGKTYTMMGPENDVPDETGRPSQRGVIPRMVDQIFDTIAHSPSDIEYTVKASYMEIYMERIRDLLDPSNDNLPIHEERSTGKGVYVKGLSEEYVASTEELYNVMRQGSKARATASTNMNAESSRSHSIFAIVVSQKNINSGSQKSGQLFLVDLAGSEKVGKTGASGQTLEEAKKINKSLTTLGMVINSLTDGKSQHVPYRDSKLTRILQESLGGNSRTSLIVNSSLALSNASETLSTLRFGMRAKNIKNKAKINAEMSPLELKQMLKRCQQQLEARSQYTQALEAEILQWRIGNTPDKSKWVDFMSERLAGMSAYGGASGHQRRPSSMSMPSSRPATPSVGGRARPQSVIIPRQNSSTILETPSGSWSLPQTPSTPNGSGGFFENGGDPIDEFMRRENEFMDQLSEKEAFIERQGRELGELRSVKAELAEALSKTERVMFEKKDLEIKIAALEERIEELNSSMMSPAELESKDAEIERLVENVRQLEERTAHLLSQNQALSSGSDNSANSDAPSAETSHLMNELQKRCERIVELEIELDIARDEYNMALTHKNSKEQQKKMQLLQKNLEQLTVVQKQLVDQNTSLKREVATSKKHLGARNDRILELERSLSNAQSDLMKESQGFESKLAFLRDRLMESKHVVPGTRKTSGGQPTNVSTTTRIVKPLRGGGTDPAENSGGIWNKLNSYVPGLSTNS